MLKTSDWLEGHFEELTGVDGTLTQPRFLLRRDVVEVKGEETQWVLLWTLKGKGA